MGHILWEVFYWPGGIIVGNMLASLVWSSLFEWRLRVHHRKIHVSIHGDKAKEGKEGDHA